MKAKPIKKPEKKNVISFDEVVIIPKKENTSATAKIEISTGRKGNYKFKTRRH